MSFQIQSGYNFTNISKPISLDPLGDKVSIHTTDKLHYGDKTKPSSPDELAETFHSLFQKALNQVNDQQIKADSLTQKLVTEPNSVDAHEVLIAAEKARIGLSLTKTIADGVVKAYRELTNLR